MASDTNVDELLRTLSKEVVKAHHVYDGSSRLIERYEAVANAANGAQCLRTDYTYDGATTNVVGMKESLGVWNSAWDI